MILKAEISLTSKTSEVLAMHEWKLSETRRVMQFKNNTLDQSDPFLIEIIKKDFLQPPSNLPYGKGVIDWSKGAMFE